MDNSVASTTQCASEDPHAARRGVWPEDAASKTLQRTAVPSRPPRCGQDRPTRAARQSSRSACALSTRLSASNRHVVAIRQDSSASSGGKCLPAEIALRLQPIGEFITRRPILTPLRVVLEGARPDQIGGRFDERRRSARARHQVRHVVGWSRISAGRCRLRHGSVPLLSEGDGSS